MFELRTLLSEIGLDNVTTCIQSGNVIFKSSEKNIRKLELNIQEVIKNYFGFEVPILVKSLKYLQRIFDDRPFLNRKG